MYKILNLILFSFCFVQQIKSQILPAEGSSLHYRIIGFKLSVTEKKTNGYSLEIASGAYYSEDSFEKNIIITLHGNNYKIIAEVPSFGSRYTWRAVCYGKNASVTNSALFHFSTKTSQNVDTTFFRFRVLKNSDKYKDAYIFIDDNKTLYDMNGKPVWFMPDIGGKPVTPRDLKLSPQGTITFMSDPPYEINYNGDILWKAPDNGLISGDKSEHYHHEFTRLSNGHYMVLGTDSVLWKHPIPSTDNNKLPVTGDDKKNPDIDSSFRKMPFGTLIEYDKNGKVTWSWNSSDYFAGSDLCYYIPPGGNQLIDVYENAFFFDEEQKVIYVSFRSISRILKIKYPEGTVINVYGEVFKSGVPETGNGFFCGQHACKHSESGLYLFNNNFCDSTALPKIIMMKEPIAGKNNLEKIWEYECTIDGITENDKKKYRFFSGGNVEELADHAMFVCMGGIYGEIFILNERREEVWSGLPERWNAYGNKWDVISEYRGSIITSRKELERLIWNSEPKK